MMRTTCDSIEQAMKGLTDVPGDLVGHITDAQALTGCTVILCGGDAVGVLGMGRADVRPGREMGEKVVMAANDAAGGEGNVGAGGGATLGKIFGMKEAMKGGIGTASLKLGSGVMVGALVAVNALGDV